MKRTLILGYGLISYAIGLASLLYMVPWLGGFLVPNAIDSSPSQPLLPALAVNGLLFLLFGIQHSVMARPKFKAWWTAIIPKSTERSTYVLASGIAMFILMLFWQPTGGIIWTVTNVYAQSALWTLYALGWAILVGSTFALNHFDLFGLRQVWLAFRDQEYSPLQFKVPGPYKYVRHPLYVGWLLLAWATPTMTVTHLLFALATAGYILLAIRWEERDLIDYHGHVYREYRANTPMLIPRWQGKHSRHSEEGLAQVAEPIWGYEEAR
ncbi:MAG: isoprenylcysteine carboxylmethyltransferase family protein [Planctomycetales bacterium]|nr:isoprenylcysteine carboxylmethyltransferase family protein [Planctomycetales bacterium]